jgi:RNA polymerase sigma-70 factor (ECF subfamily)
LPETSDTDNRFEAEVLPCLDAAYSLARWLVRDEHAAEDVVQDAYLRALRYYGSFRGGDARPWLLGIVRNCCYSWFAQQKRSREVECDAEDADGPSLDSQHRAETPETLLLQKLERAQVSAAISRLPVPLREALVLREMEELSYEDIARVLDIPKGTVMSRLSRARRMLYDDLSEAGGGLKS